MLDSWKTFIILALLFDSFVLTGSIMFPGSDELTYYRFTERQWVTFVSAVKLTMIATLSLSCFTVWAKGKHFAGKSDVGFSQSVLHVPGIR